MSKKKMLMRKFGVVIGANNTFIGGVAGTINTPALLASTLGILESRITNFIVGATDIECTISGTYNLPYQCFHNNSNITFFDDIDGLVTTISVQSFSICINLRRVFLPNCMSSPNDAFPYNSVKSLLIYIPNITSLGDPTINNSHFYSIEASSIIYAHPSLQTANAGGVEADLAYAISRGVTVRYVANFTAPSQVTDLSLNTVYETAVKLQWTEPTNINGIDFYEIYVNGILNNTTKNLSGHAIGLTNGVTYDFTVKAIDNFYNKSIVSNVISQQINGVTNWWEDFMISYYNYNDNILDQFGTNNGAENNITYGVGKSGNAAIFNGSSSYISVNDSSSLSFTNGTNDLPFTISYAIKFNVLTSGSQMWIFGKRTSAAVFEYQFSVYNGTCYFDIYDSTNNAYIRNTFSWTLFNTTNTFIVTHTYGGNGLLGMRTYINGVLVNGGRSTVGTYSRMRNTTAPLIFGRRDLSSAFYLNGWLDVMPILNKELTQSEVTNLVLAQNSGLELI